METEAQNNLAEKLKALGIIQEDSQEKEKKTYEKVAIYRLNNRSLTTEWSEEKEALFKPGITANIPKGDTWEKEHIDSFKAVVIFWAEGRSLFSKTGEVCGSIIGDRPVAKFESPPCRQTTREELVKLISEDVRLSRAKVNLDSVIDEQSNCLNVCGVRDSFGNFMPLCSEARHGGGCKPLVRVFGWDTTNERFFWMDLKGASIKRSRKKDEKTGQWSNIQSPWWDFTYETNKYQDFTLGDVKLRKRFAPYTYEVTVSPKTDLMKWFYHLNFTDIKFRGLDETSIDAFEMLANKQAEALASLTNRQSYKKEEKVKEEKVKEVQEDYGLGSFAVDPNEINF